MTLVSRCSLGWLLVIELVLGVGAYTDARCGGSVGSHEQIADSAVWKFSRSAMFTSGGEPLTPEIGLLLSKLGKKGADGAPVSRKEFIALLDRPEAMTVYGESIMRYASPQSIDEQARFHINLTKRLLSDESQQAGLDFLRKQRAYLRRAEKRFHVNRQDIVSILMWESGLGKNTGSYRIFNVYLGPVVSRYKSNKYNWLSVDGVTICRGNSVSS